MTAEQALTRALDFAANDASDVVEAMKKRVALFSPRQAVLAGVAMEPGMRRMVDEAIQDAWDNDPVSVDGYEEVIVGSGVHAAIYCAVRAQRGKPKPLVIESSARPGGVMAMTKRPAFNLNSRNWPGPPGLPAEQANVNYFPGFPVQLAECCIEPFPSNDMVAFLTRVVLARYAVVLPRTTVTDMAFQGVTLSDGDDLEPARVIDARGMGTEANTGIDRVVTFTGLMQKIDAEMFPFQGLRRVAVVGGQDSGKCAVESLLGIAPSRHLSAAGIDFIERIDWYVTPDAPAITTREQWRQRARGRYQLLGSYIPREANARQTSRVRVIQRRGVIGPGMGFATVNNRQYDLVVRCTGQQQLPYIGEAAYQIGAVSAGPFTSDEASTPAARRPESQVAFFRLAPLTARLAMTLD